MSKKVLAMFLILGCAAVGAAMLIGIGDNPAGVGLVYLGVASFVLAVVHRWRSPKRFVILCVASLVGFPVAVLLHNGLYAVEVAAPTMPGVAVAGALHVVFFLAALILCPVGVLIGGVGSIVARVRAR